MTTIADDGRRRFEIESVSETLKMSGTGEMLALRLASPDYQQTAFAPF